MEEFLPPLPFLEVPHFLFTIRLYSKSLVQCYSYTFLKAVTSITVERGKKGKQALSYLVKITQLGTSLGRKSFPPPYMSDQLQMQKRASGYC